MCCRLQYPTALTAFETETKPTWTVVVKHAPPVATAIGVTLTLTAPAAFVHRTPVKVRWSSDRICFYTYGRFTGPSCSDSVRNGDDTDVDCGGSTCPQCTDTNVCSVRSDCISGVCASNICQSEFIVR